jgi:hypothetical protein
MVRAMSWNYTGLKKQVDTYKEKLLELFFDASLEATDHGDSNTNSEAYGYKEGIEKALDTFKEIFEGVKQDE